MNNEITCMCGKHDIDPTDEQIIGTCICGIDIPLPRYVNILNSSMGIQCCWAEEFNPVSDTIVELEELIEDIREEG